MCDAQQLEEAKTGAAAPASGGALKNRPRIGPPSNSAYGGALAAGGGSVKGTEGLDDLFATAPAPQPAGEWIEAFDKNRCATAGCWRFR